MGGIKEVELPEGRTLKIRVKLSEREQENLLSVLSKYIDALAWTLSVMPRIDPDFVPLFKPRFEC